MSVHSKLLGVDNAVPTTGHTLYTTPVGKTAIVKNITIEGGAAAAQRVIFQVYNGATQVFAFGVTVGASASTTESMIVSTWMVLPAGYILKALTGAGTCQVIVSGAELTN